MQQKKIHEKFKNKKQEKIKNPEKNSKNAKKIP